MCGITGIYHRRNQTPDPRVLDAMTDRLAHRGPDARGTYLFENAALGHRRLSIIGITDGIQPMTNEDGTVWVSYNGEIYNYLPLKKELEALGHTFKTHSDTEVIVHGWEAWGTGVAKRLRGIFAFAIHDQKQRTLVVCRDRLGVKPLYYHASPELFLFASEPKALLLHPDMPKRPDMDSIYLYLRYGYMPAHHAAFEGMKQLEPGRLMVVTETSIKEERYWVPPAPGSGRHEKIDDVMDRLIDESVSIELMSEVPLGAFLSGGIDSSTVVAAMAREPGLTERPKTFCIGFPVAEFDESKYSRMVADALKLDHHVEIVQIESLSGLDTLVETYDEPFGDSSAIPVYALCRMAKKYVTVALSGDGGDELFAGYRRYPKVANMFLLPELGRKLIGTAAHFYPPGMRGVRRLRKYASTIGEQYDYDLSHFPRHLIAEIGSPELLRNPDFSIAKVFEEAPGETLVQKAQYTDIVTYLPGDILTKVDRASMAHALEVRVPLLDHVFVEWALSLPIEQTFGNGEMKVALKRHLGRRVPKEIFERPKMGFGVPLSAWLGGDNGLARLADKLRSNHPRGEFYSPLRATAVDLLIRRHGASWDHSTGIWTLLFLESWWQKFFR